MLEDQAWSAAGWGRGADLPIIFLNDVHDFVNHFVLLAAPWQLLKTTKYYWVLKDRVLFGFRIPIPETVEEQLPQGQGAVQNPSNPIVPQPP